MPASPRDRGLARCCRGHQHHPRPGRPRAPTDTHPYQQTDEVVPCIDSVSDSQQVAMTNSGDAHSMRSLKEKLVDFDDKLEFETRIPDSQSQICAESEDKFSFREDRLATVGSVATEASVEDPETAELAKLRCASACVEVLAVTENQRRIRADYPGLAFGSCIFYSGTTMKFSIIKNELQNIKNTALKRAESDVAGLSRRVQLLKEGLESCEERLAASTAELVEASRAVDESARIREALENRTNMEDDRVAILEAQLAQAKLIAAEADKKYAEVSRELELIERPEL